jgi:O-antigen ligase
MGWWRSPIVVVVAAAFGVALWHGGYTRGGLLAFAAVGVAGVALVRPAPSAATTALICGLAATGIANLVSLAWHDQGSTPIALAAVAMPLLVWAGSSAQPELRRWLPLAVLALALCTGTAGLAGFALHSTPLAERIDGVWRAGGTFEYPPALGLVCVCALAAALALHAAGELDATGAVVSAALLTAAAAASFDRVAWIETAAVLVLFAVRAPAVRRTVALTAAVTACAAVAVLAIAHPHAAALERHLRHGPISSRTDTWREAWDLARERPWIGYGPGRYAAAESNGPFHFLVVSAPPPTRAHNAVLEQAVGAGIVAALGTAVALLAMLWAGCRGLASRDPRALSFGVAAAAVALSGLYDFTWSFPPLLLLGALSAVAVWEQP